MTLLEFYFETNTQKEWRYRSTFTHHRLHRTVFSLIISQIVKSRARSLTLVVTVT